MLCRTRGSGVYQAGQTHSLAWNRLYKRNGSRRGMIWGGGGGGTDLSVFAAGMGNVRAWLKRRIPVGTFNTDWTWGNDTSLARVTDLRSYLVAQGDFASGKFNLAAGSMGAIIALNYLRHHPENLNAVAISVPAVSLEWHHDNGYETEIDAAYGDHAGYLAALSTHSPYHAPAEYASVPLRAWISDNDTTAPTALAQEFIDAVPGATRVSLGAVGHGSASTWPVADEMADFFEENE